MQNRNKPEGVNIGYILDVVSRNRWFLIIPFMVILLAGIVLAFTLPKMYEAKALILVRPQKVAKNFVQTMESANIDSRINTISQQIMSRSNLEKIINRYGLFSNPEGKELYREEKIALLRERITVEAIKRDKRAPADAFSIAFRDKDPKIAMQVTNAFANYVIDENLKARQEQTVGTAQFLEEEQAAVGAADQAAGAGGGQAGEALVAAQEDRVDAVGRGAVFGELDNGELALSTGEHTRAPPK